ncbi:MAG: hypothetical protein RR439_08790 [Carnobacterium sp.]
MPETTNGREKVLNFLEESDINFVDLGVMYGMTKQDVTSYLTGKLKNTPAANKLILKIISDFRIR